MQLDYFKFRNENQPQCDVMKKIFKIYPRLRDSQSRRVFVNCVMYSLTKEVSFLHDNIMLIAEGEKFDKKLDMIGIEKIYVYGAGERGKRLVEMFPDKNWGGFIDKQKSGFYNGLPIFSIDEVCGIKENYIIVSILNNYQEAKELLIKKGCKEQNVLVLEEWNEEIRRKQYVEERCLEGTILNGGIIDAGSFDGQDVIRLLDAYGDNSITAWIFEPDKIQMRECKRKLANLSNVIFYEQGISDNKASKKMLLKAGGLSKITEKGNEEIEIVALDEVLSKEQVGLIKMDVEGFEMSALKGARQIISRQKPIVAISVYHKQEDIWDIPSILLDMNPNYQFALGHYSIGQVDTVLYAF